MFKYLFFLLFCAHSFAETRTLTSQGRTYKLVVPEGASTQRPMLVLLHGCKQNADLILKGTDLEAQAQKKNFLILVPEQSIQSNSDHCWNWFYSQFQTRGAFTEMSEIINTMEIVIKDFHVDRSKLFLAGMSAGGALAESFMACYPDYFSGVAIHSGLAYKAAENVYEAQTVITSPIQKSPDYLGQRAVACAPGVKRVLKKLLIIHGMQDPRVPVLHAGLISSTHEVMASLLGYRTSTQDENIINFPNGYKAHVTDTHYSSLVERKIIVDGLKHAWGAGKPLSANFDPQAPSSNAFILDFFNL